MRIILFGSTDFSCEIIDSLLGLNHQLVGLITLPGRNAGRGLNLKDTPVKIKADKLNIPVSVFDDLTNKQVEQFLEKQNADLFLVVAYGKIIPQKILEIPKVMTLGLHPSLLPKYRGAAPINWALINGESKTGVTFYKVNKKMDAGDILFQEEVLIEVTDNFISLEKKLIERFSYKLKNVLDDLENNKFNLKVQDDNLATFAVKISKDSAKISWQKSSKEIYNLIRGLVPYPCAFFNYQSKRIRVWEAEIIFSNSENKNPGEAVWDKDILRVATKEGVLQINKLQLENKSVIAARDFINGYLSKQGKPVIFE